MLARSLPPLDQLSPAGPSPGFSPPGSLRGSSRALGGGEHETQAGAREAAGEGEELAADLAPLRHRIWSRARPSPTDNGDRPRTAPSPPGASQGQKLAMQAAVRGSSPQELVGAVRLQLAAGQTALSRRCIELAARPNLFLSNRRGSPPISAVHLERAAGAPRGGPPVLSQCDAAQMQKEMEFVRRRITSCTASTSASAHTLDVTATINTPRQVRALAAVLCSSTRITALLLGSNGLRDEMCATLSGGLRSMPQLTHLDLSNNRLRDLAWLPLILTPSSPKDVPIPLQSLQLGDNPLSERGAEELEVGLRFNVTLRSVSLARCALPEPAALRLARMLQDAVAISALHLAWNKLTLRATQALASGFSASPTLEHLDLRHCGLGEPGGCAIALALQANSSLRTVLLASNQLGPSTCEVLAGSLEKNSALRTLDLQDNPIGFSGAVKIAKSMEKTQVQRVLLQGCSFGRLKTREAGGGAAWSPANFNAQKPNGSYRLQLDDPQHYHVACELLKLWQSEGPASWEDVKYEGSVLVLTEAMNWPDRMPVEGVLELTFRSSRRQPRGKATVSARVFAALWADIDHSAVSDQWRLDLVKVLADSLFFDAVQAGRMLEAFEWGGSMKLEAASVLFGSLLDLGGMERMLQPLSEAEQEALMQRIGILSIFHHRNPTGHYELNLMRQVDSAVALRLLSMWEEEQKAMGPYAQCWRNVYVNGDRVELAQPHPPNWSLPEEGTLELDYVTYKRPRMLSMPMPSAAFDLFVHELRASNPSKDSRRVTKRVNMMAKQQGMLYALTRPAAAAEEGDKDCSALSATPSEAERELDLELGGLPTVQQRGPLMEALRRRQRQERYERLQSRVLLLRGVAVDNHLDTAQLILLLKALRGLTDSAVLRQTAVVVFFARMTTRAGLSEALRVLSQAELDVVASRLGYLNIINFKHPDMHYRLRMGIKDEWDAFKRLAQLASKAPGYQNLRNLKVDNKPFRAVEDSKLWHTLSGGDFTNPRFHDRVVEFDFVTSPSMLRLAAVTVIQIHWKAALEQSWFKRKKRAVETIRNRFKAWTAQKAAWALIEKMRAEKEAATRLQTLMAENSSMRRTALGGAFGGEKLTESTFDPIASEDASPELSPAPSMVADQDAGVE